MTKGGKRNGAGRKPCTEKKQQITIYVLTSQIKKENKVLTIKKLKNHGLHS